MAYENECYVNKHLLFVSNWTHSFAKMDKYEQRLEIAEREVRFYGEGL